MSWIRWATIAMVVSLIGVSTNDAATHAATLPTLWSACYYGPRLKVGGLANTPIGSSVVSATGNNRVAIRFSPGQTGQLIAVHTLWPTRPGGYIGGNGGTIRVELQTDDGTPNHFPSGVALAAFQTPDNDALNFFDQNRNESSFKAMPFASPTTVVAGTLYHLVFTNVSPTRIDNYMSVDFVYTTPRTVPVQPTYTDTELQALDWYDGGPWITGKTLYANENPPFNVTPILQLDYANGFSEGRGIISELSTTAVTISGGSSLREQFTPTLPMSFTGLGIVVQRASGIDSLTVQIVHDATGQVIASTTFGAGLFPVPNQDYYVQSGPRSSTLAAGTTYDLVLIAPSTSVYNANGFKDGSYLYWDDVAHASPLAYWGDTEGSAQENPGTGQWAPYSGQNNVHLQWFLTLPCGISALAGQVIGSPVVSLELREYRAAVPPSHGR